MSPMPYSPTDLVVTASEIFSKAGYRNVSVGFSDWNTATTRLFEDEYCIIGVVVFETRSALVTGWPAYQGKLVDVISDRVGKDDPKSWEGYLVLLTPGLGSTSQLDIEEIRYNTTRLRKIVATGDHLKAPGELERVLRSLLPLRFKEIQFDQESILEILPSLLASENIDETVTKTMIESFRKQLPLLDRLHETLNRQ